MSEWVKVATLDQIPPGGRLFYDFEEETVVVFNVAGKLYCIADLCTHDGGPLGDGPLEGCQITCPRHGARFDVRDGSVLSMPAVVPVPSYRVRLEGNDVLVESPDEAW